MAVEPTFDEYRAKYANAKLSREDGILEVVLHTDGQELIWTQTVHDELGYLFADIAGDRENAVVVLTGTGKAFCERLDGPSFKVSTPVLWDSIIYNGRRLLGNLLDIPVPVIAAVNGPATYHPELPALCDIVIAADTATFRDTPHFMSGVVPGDGAQLVWTHLLGPNRGRYFLLTGETMSAQTALDRGVVSEVLRPEDLMDRARELAQLIAEKPYLTRRYARTVLTQSYKRMLNDGIPFGLALQGLGALDSWPLHE